MSDDWFTLHFGILIPTTPEEWDAMEQDPSSSLSRAERAGLFIMQDDKNQFGGEGYNVFVGQFLRRFPRGVLMQRILSTEELLTETQPTAQTLSAVGFEQTPALYLTWNPFLTPQTEWLSNRFKECQTVRVGMTRKEILEVYSYHSGLQGEIIGASFSHRKCAYIQVDVDFTPAGGFKYDDEGRVLNEARYDDVISRISKPYLSHPREL